MTSIFSRIRRNFALLFGSAGASLAFGLVTSVVNARSLGASGVGTLALAHSLALLIQGLFLLGTQQPIIKLGRDALENDRKRQFAYLVRLGFGCDVVASILAWLISAAILSGYYSTTPDPFLPAPIAYFYSIVVLFSFTPTATGTLRLFDRFSLIAGAQAFVSAAICLVALVYSAAAVDISLYLVTNALIYSSAAVYLVAVAIATLRRNGISLRANQTSHSDQIDEFRSYLWTTFVTSSTNSVKNNIDGILLSMHHGVELLGIYSIAKQVAGVVNKVSGIGTVVIFPEIATLSAKHQVGTALSIFRRVRLIGPLAAVFGYLICFTLGAILLRNFFGEKFVSGNEALPLLVFSAILFMFATLLGGFTQVFRSPIYFLRIYLISLFFYLIAGILLIPSYGILGCALSQVAFSFAMYFGVGLSLSGIQSKR